ncbi:MAG: hypothetical protein LKG79_07465 [Furfurilactobacillus sp.]|uniref:hypothetical protein n=1 Tax=Furfurilactobacillus sp. TaxID=2767911 RepID=UPI002585C3A6|nr:hypothetical protein [Furfurilactobacillus sp.]MCH4010584.1 hypothetical protein [Furfurilactobacillus sp.]MCH4036476.1 hypothetical protein [Furfurilactobacillus sp.]MCH4114578.1 hypothetical protein [Furfurilactobacillus sp.]MCH4133803.1 hypothetical protein [Furfurilactobacillus sp.]MCI1340160.1 hypothetical protein [Furfurilactobacillus sp.]
MKHRRRCYHTKSGVNYLSKIEALYGSGEAMYYREGDPYTQVSPQYMRAVEGYQQFRKFYQPKSVKHHAKG